MLRVVKPDDDLGAMPFDSIETEIEVIVMQRLK